MSRRLTHEEYVRRIEKIHPDIEVLGVYVDYKTKILHKCKIDGYEWYATPSSTLQGHGCSMCNGGIQKTHEQYIKELSETNRPIVVVGQYINSSTPILHKCLIDGHEWLASPNNILKGRGCPICGGTLLKTHEQYVDELKIKNPSVIVVGKYINRITKIMHKCLIHNYEWEIAPASALTGCRCPICTMEKLRNRFSKSHNDYIAEVSLINEDIEVLGRYINATTKISHKCLICGFEWDVLPESILQGHGCPMCARKITSENRKMSHEEYVLRVKKINSNIEVIDEYVSARTPILHRCKIDGHKWYGIPDSILRGSGCPVCAGNKKYEHNEYVNKVAKTNLNIEVIGEYINGLTPILHKCKIDGYEWYARPSAILYGGGCPKCRISKGEKKIANWLEKMNILYKSQMIFEDCKNINFLPFDFYLPKYNICIEYQGEQHYKPVEYFGGEETFKKQVLRDNIKKEYCQKNNMILFEVPYYSDLDKELATLYELITTFDVQKGVTGIA